jgi:hypothetical protein
LRADFVRLVADLLATRTAVSSLIEGDDVDPAVAWFDLRDEQSQLRYVETFARQLRVPTTELFPSLADINERKKVTIAKLQAKRAEHLAAFQDLIVQMQAMRSAHDS